MATKAPKQNQPTNAPRKRGWLTHIAILLAMLILSCAYFSPALSGKVIRQGDTQKNEAMMKESKDYHQATGEYTHWNSAMFSGMPNYQVGGGSPQKSIFTTLRHVLALEYIGHGRDIGILFLYLLGFYVALLVFGASPWLALTGALAFGLGSYNIIIIEAGHITKAWALGLMAPILAGMALCFRRPKGEDEESARRSKRSDLVWGGLLFTVALGVQLASNHVQITYYTVIGAVMLGIAYLIYAVKEKRVAGFAKGLGVLLLGCAFAFAGNAKLLIVSQQYAKYTMRGGNAITVTPEDLYNDSEPSSIAGKTSGLNIDYAFSWSYGIGETYTLLVPGAMGGGSVEPMDEESQFYKNFRSDQAPLYWGDQPFTSGPVYFGAIVVMLFILGLFVVKGPEKWWLLAATVLAIVMSWGRHFMGFNEWLFNNLPLYNKFRTPSISLVLANVAMVFMAVLALKHYLDGSATKDATAAKKANRALYIATGITAGAILIGMMVAGSFCYSGAGDRQMAGQYGNQWGFIQDALVNDRKALFMSDSWRSLIFVLLGAAVIWFYHNKAGKGTVKHGVTVAATLALTLLVTIDLWGVDRRYLNDKNFVAERSVMLTPSETDKTIDEYAARFGDKDFRVFDLSVNTFNDSYPSAFHRQVGGYSAVKMRRYQDLIDFYLSYHINNNVLNMLNTRYVVTRGQGGPVVQRNPEALGNAWLVDSCRMVADANAEILALNNFDPRSTAIVDKSRFNLEQSVFATDSNDFIEMEHTEPYNPGLRTYHVRCSSDRLAVFSEIYYEPDWVAYIDGKKADYISADYVLRAMLVPAGEHTIEFRDEAPLAKKMDRVSVAGSIIFALTAAGALAIGLKKKKVKQQH